jgi:hypothetical protein
MDLRSLRVALRATWRRLHHLQGTLTSAVGHADATLSEYDRLKTTLPDALEKQQLAVALEGEGEGGEGQVERRPSTGADKVEEAVKDPAEQKKRRRKSVAATRTMLGQAITDFSTQVYGCVEKGAIVFAFYSFTSGLVFFFFACMHAHNT